MTLAMHAALISEMPERMLLYAFRNKWSMSTHGELPESPPTESIFEALERISKSIPEEALRNIPTDWALNYGKYLYGK